MLNLKQKCVFGGIQTSQTGGQPYSNTFPYEVSLYSLVKPIHRNSYEICLWKGNVRMHFISISISTKSKFKFHRFCSKMLFAPSTFYYSPRLFILNQSVRQSQLAEPISPLFSMKFFECLHTDRDNISKPTPYPLPPQPFSSVTSKKSRKCL